MVPGFAELYVTPAEGFDFDMGWGIVYTENASLAS
jgi:hypothetical protein